MSWNSLFTIQRCWLQYRKIYIFFVNNNSFFCVIFYIVAFVCDDEIFLIFDIIFRIMFTLEVRSELNCQSIQWHEKMKKMFVFHAFRFSKRKKNKESRESLLYDRYQEWMKRLREKIDFVQILITYCLRRTTDNVINDKFREVWFKKRLIDWIKRFQFEWDDAQSDVQSRQFDDNSTKLFLSHDSLQYANNLSRHCIAKRLNRCFSSNESHDRFSSILWLFLSIIAEFETECAYSRVARTLTISLRTNSRQILLHLSNKKSVDLR